MRNNVAAVAALVLAACAAENAPPKNQLKLDRFELAPELRDGEKVHRPAEGNVYAIAHLTEDPGGLERREGTESLLEDWDGRRYRIHSASQTSSESDAPGLFNRRKIVHPNHYRIVFEIPRTATPRTVIVPETVAVAPPPVSQYDQGPKVLSRVAPLYPESARRVNLRERVKLEVLVLADGRVGGARTVDGNGILGDAAAEAVRQWRYAPAVLDGKPVTALTEVTIDFRSEPPPAP